MTNIDIVQTKNMRNGSLIDNVRFNSQLNHKQYRVTAILGKKVQIMACRPYGNDPNDKPETISLTMFNRDFLPVDAIVEKTGTNN